MNLLTIAVLLLFIILAIVGGARGFLKIGLSLGSIIISAILMVVVSPYVSKVIMDKTPVYGLVQDAFIENFLPDVSAEELVKTDLTGTPLEGYSAEDIEAMTRIDWERTGFTPRDLVDLVGEIPEEIQKEKIKNSILPEVIKRHILENNVPEIYEELGETSFPGYVSAYIARMMVTLISFAVTFIIVCILMKALSAIVEIIDIIPVIGWLNHVAGVLAGLLMALLIVWLVFIGITIISTFNVGGGMLEMIQTSPMLRILYENNIILKKLLMF